MGNAARSDIPQHIADLTAPWLTAALAPKTGGATVTDVSSTEIGAGVGFMGEVHRLHLEWDGDDAELLPASIIAKIPSRVPQNRALGELLKVYEREILAYRHVGDRFGVAAPEFWFGEFDPGPPARVDAVVGRLIERLPARGAKPVLNALLKAALKSKRRYLLLIGDVVGAREPSQIVGGSVDDAVRALDTLAAFHAANWQPHDLIAEHSWLIGGDRFASLTQASFLRNRDAFLERFAHVLTDAHVRFLDRMQSELKDRIKALAEPPLVLTHGDYRLDNLMFREEGPVVVLDWQGLGFAIPAVDVTYFIITALNPEHRAEEQLLLETYHRALVDRGVTDYPLERLLADVPRVKEVLGHRMVAGDDLIDGDIDGSDNLIDVVVERTLGWIDTDHF